VLHRVGLLFSGPPGAAGLLFIQSSNNVPEHSPSNGQHKCLFWALACLKSDYAAGDPAAAGHGAFRLNNSGGQKYDNPRGRVCADPASDAGKRPEWPVYPAKNRLRWARAEKYVETFTTR